jgi:hypothetical protein
MHPVAQPQPTGPLTQPNGPGTPPQPGPPQLPPQSPPSPPQSPPPQSPPCPCPWPWPSCCHGICGAFGKGGAAFATPDPSPRAANPSVLAIVTLAAIAFRFIMRPLYATSRFATFAPNRFSDPKLLRGTESATCGLKPGRCHALPRRWRCFVSSTGRRASAYLVSVTATSPGAIKPELVAPAGGGGTREGRRSVARIALRTKPNRLAFRAIADDLNILCRSALRERLERQNRQCHPDFRYRTRA